MEPRPKPAIDGARAGANRDFFRSSLGALQLMQANFRLSLDRLRPDRATGTVLHLPPKLTSTTFLHRGRSPALRLLGAVTVVWTCGWMPAAHAQDDAGAGLKQLSLEDLLSLQVTTMSRKAESWWSAPGAAEVLTAEDIRRTGAERLPDILRFATGMDVAQANAGNWAVSARGFNVLAANKLAVTIDGRSLFTPFFSGVLWDVQDTLIEDLERVEVVRGPVGAMWGAYAVNGVVQFITKPADATQGGLISTVVGTHGQARAAVRHGGRISGNTFYRVYVKYHQSEWSRNQTGRPSAPEFDFLQGGFRADSALASGATVTLQGDAYTNKGLPKSHLQTTFSGANLLGRWQQFVTADTQWDLSSYLDFTKRLIPGAWSEQRRTFAGSAQFQTTRGPHEWMLGFDGSISSDKIGQLSVAQMSPSQRTVHNIGFFAQDTLTLVPEFFALTAGTKIDHNSFTGVEIHPSLRAAWTPSRAHTLWAAVSRAVRTPVRVDHDLVFRTEPVEIVRATDAFKSESVIAFEIGSRHQLGPDTAVEIATFHNRYTDIRSYEWLGNGTFPLTFGNGWKADSTGAELTLHQQAGERVMLRVSYRYLDLEFSRRPGFDALFGTSVEANDPRHIGQITAHVDLTGAVNFDATLRHVSARPDPASAAYTVVDLRLAWRPDAAWEFSLVGRDLFAPAHHEIIPTNSGTDLVGPSAHAKMAWRF